MFLHPRMQCNMKWSRTGARFSKDPKHFGRISGRIILSVSWKRRRLEARNFAVILIYTSFTSYEKTSFTELAGRSFTNGFSGPKSFRDFRETPAPQKTTRYFSTVLSKGVCIFYLFIYYFFCQKFINAIKVNSDTKIIDKRLRWNQRIKLLCIQRN